jgi:hypothetical protein
VIEQALEMVGEGGGGMVTVAGGDGLGELETVAGFVIGIVAIGEAGTTRLRDSVPIGEGDGQ